MQYSPQMTGLLRLTENAYTMDELKAAERLVLKILQFDVVLPTPLTCLDRCVKVCSHQVDKETLLQVGTRLSC